MTLLLAIMRYRAEIWRWFFHTGQNQAPTTWQWLARSYVRLTITSYIYWHFLVSRLGFLQEI
jgi:hypothetical protein